MPAIEDLNEKRNAEESLAIENYINTLKEWQNAIKDISLKISRGGLMSVNDDAIKNEEMCLSKFEEARDVVLRIRQQIIEGKRFQ